MYLESIFGQSGWCGDGQWSCWWDRVGTGSGRQLGYGDCTCSFWEWTWEWLWSGGRSAWEWWVSVYSTVSVESVGSGGTRLTGRIRTVGIVSPVLSLPSSSSLSSTHPSPTLTLLLFPTPIFSTSTSFSASYHHFNIILLYSTLYYPCLFINQAQKPSFNFTYLFIVSS